MRVLIGPDTDDLRELYAAPQPSWLRVNFVATLDGAASGESGKSGSINNAADKQVFDTLRDLADAVVVGAGTARAEGYRPWAKPTVLVSRSAAVPESLAGGEPGDVLMVTTERADGLSEARDLLGDDHVLALGAEAVDLTALRPALAERGLRQLLCEGGPHLFGDLLAAGQVDELCKTWVPKLLAGDSSRIAVGSAVAVDLELTLLMDDDSTLLGRWLVSRDPA